MIAYVTSVGEETTDLCCWALRRNGFDVVLIEDPKSTLAEKLELIYTQVDEDFIRVDADVIVNRACTPHQILIAYGALSYAWWIQFQCWGWYSQDLIYGGVQYVRKEALPALRANVEESKKHNRPETFLSRIPEFYNPRRFDSYKKPMGIHGYGIKDIKPIIRQKANRGQSANYDFELTQRMNSL